MGKNTSNIFMRPLVVKIFMITSVVLVYVAFIYSGFLTFIPPDIKSHAAGEIGDAIGGGQFTEVLGNLGWYNLTELGSDANWFLKWSNLSVAGIVGICVIGIAIVFNIFVSFWYKKTDFSIGKDKTKILSIYTAPIIGMIFAVVVGLVAYPDLSTNGVGSLLPNSPNYLFEIAPTLNGEINEFLGTQYTFTTIGWVLFAIEAILVLVAIFGLIGFLFRIISKSKWQNKAE